MEASHPLSIESFSYSWLVNLKPSLDGCDQYHECDEASSFIEMDPRMPPSKRFFRNSQDFKFDFPISQPPIKLVHADELFSDGYVVPLFVNSMKMESYNEYERVSDSVSTTMPIIAASDSVLHQAGGKQPNRLRRCRRLSKRMLLKYLDFIRPLYRRIRGRSSSKSSCSMAESTKKKKKWLYSAETSSPRISVAYSAPDEWRNSCDSDGSIYEAVLHCKKSIGT